LHYLKFNLKFYCLQHASKLGLSNSLLLRVNRSVNCEIQKSPQKSASQDERNQLKGLTYHKLRIQRRLPRILSDIATQYLNAPKTLNNAKIPWEQSAYKPREFLIFDHDLPMSGGQKMP
jgi:hypothetical protein